MSVKHAAGTHTRHVWLSQRLPQMRGQLKSVAHVITSPAKIRCVHCDKDTLIPGLLSPPDQRLSQRSVFINVQLHPAHGPRCGLRYLLDSGSGPWAQHHPRVTGQAGCGREETRGDVRTAGWLSWGCCGLQDIQWSWVRTFKKGWSINYVIKSVWDLHRDNRFLTKCHANKFLPKLYIGTRIVTSIKLW